jgi:cytochrome b involved in lipid metabolism
MLKKYITATIFISWAFFTAVLVAGLVFYQNSKPPISVVATPDVTGGQTITLTTQEIAQHSSAIDCWLIINQQVYDVTTYLNQHPGNADTILPYCGQEATAAFNTKGRSTGNTHSTVANDLLGNYLLGSVGQTITRASHSPVVTSTPSNKNASATVTPARVDGQTVTLNTQEIAKHNSGTDCWLIINQQVYNVTTYLNQHPGNASTILPYCGQDGTTAFDTKGRSAGNTHSSFANNLLGQFLIGSVGDSVSSSTINPSVTIPAGRGDDDDD